MTDLAKTIVPKSDQLNADDLITGPITITITQVRGCDDADQPVAVHFEGDERKPYKPCKSMRRVMVHCWGADGKAYAGRRMTLYRDENVQFGGIKVGGIRISHMSHIDREMVMALTATRAKRTPYSVKPLRAEVAEARTRREEPLAAQEPRSEAPPDDSFPGDAPSAFDVLAWADDLERNLPDYAGVDVLREDWADHKAELHEKDPARFKDLNQKIARRATEIAGAS